MMRNPVGRVAINIYDDDRGIEASRSQHCPITTIVGSLEISKVLIMDGSIKTNPFMTHVKDMKHTKSKARLKKYKRDDAMKIYMKLGQKIQDRLLAMQKCDDVADFEIDDDLLTKL